jgi:hypothetical protein
MSQRVPRCSLQRPVGATPNPIQYNCLGSQSIGLTEPVFWGLTHDTQQTCSPSVDQARKKADQRLGVLGPILDRRGGLSIRNRVLLYKQLIWPMMDLFPIRRSGACTHVRRPQVLQSKCLRIAAGAPRYIPFFPKHIKCPN